MSLAFFDVVVIALYLTITLIIGFWFRKSAGQSLGDFFLGGRKLPWYIAGISMVATTFAADTPLYVADEVAKNGISGNWLWWNMLIGGALTTFFFSRLWRRAGIITELEFIELRYGGKPAAFLRGLKAVYIGLFLNTLIIAWVNIALMKIVNVFFPVSDSTLYIIVAAAMLFALLYSAASGLLGIALTDAFQFVIAMTGSIILAVIVIKSPEIGGIDGLKAQLNQYSEGYLRFFPTISKSGYFAKSLSIGIWGFLAFIGLQWWASWYPGNEPGGGGYVAQRMMSTKSENDSILATLFFQIAHYALRPWPWIIVGLAAVILYPQLGANEKELGFVMAIKDYMPVGLKGLLLVAMLAAYMSTISTQLNLGASFMVNDIYKRFIYKEKYYTTNDSDPEKRFVLVGRIATILLAALGLYATSFFTTIKSVWEFLLSCGAGLGLVLILRWFWWRINAWSEISATLAPILMVILFQHVLKIPFPISLYPIVGSTILIWLLVMYYTKPENEVTLTSFCDRIRPIGFWKKVGFEYSPPKRYYSALFLGWISAVISVYSILFGIGKLILQEYYHTLGWFIAALIYLVVLVYVLKYINETDY